MGGGGSLAFNLITGVASLGSAVSAEGSFAINLSGSTATILAPIGDNFAGFVGYGGLGTGFRYAAALNPSSSVGPEDGFAANTSWAANSAIMDFFGTTAKFVGLRFDIGENTHYGWAQVHIGMWASDATLTMFGYNDTAGAASHIPVPEPSSLGLLAIGAAGLARRRRKKTQV